MDDRSVAVTIGGEEYKLLLTTRATMEIAQKYGGLDKMGENMMQSDNIKDALEEICWLIALLANQSITIWNLWNPSEAKSLLSTEKLEYMTSPADIADLKDNIMLAITKGMKRNVISEDDTKNAVGE
ncbi:hypothetical protein KQI82_12375 [Oscillibacter sp. MSJ-2]|uniref:Phage protein n=1 Tax=Dysosmobacter acutus TaxID=2841504 RepID=A0ABS6FBQ8_9FIRM|nr:hypothetical protein [Dysosmobacter acutus]MBU5627705.1 hypothetical protein [Dysosmobacter acutus]